MRCEFVVTSAIGATHVTWIGRHTPKRLTSMQLIQPQPSYDWLAILTLIQNSFAYMHDVVDPPSSMHRLTTEGLIAHARDVGEVWVFDEDGPRACMVLTPKADALYLGKVAIAPAYRRRGLARMLVDKAGERALALGYSALELQVRIELIDNHRAFAAMGFVKTGETAHEGYDRSTSITMRKSLSAD